MSSKSKSIVWKYFIRTDNGGKCKLCQMIVKTGGNTTNLKNHLKRKHETLNQSDKENNKKQKIQCEVSLNFIIQSSIKMFSMI